MLGDDLAAAACHPDDPARHDPQRIRAVLTRLGLGHRLAAGEGDAALAGLSMGERQRLGLARGPGVLLERIGRVETVQEAEGEIRLGGACHDARIALGPIAEVVVDRSSIMRDKVMPRVELRAASGALLVSAIGLEGLDPFEAALEGLTRAPAAEAAKPEEDPAPVLAEDHPGLAPFETLLDAGAEVAIELELPGLRQMWRGRIEELKPMMGFLNIMTADFHLHLRGGSVSGWAAEPGLRCALGPDGAPTGLTLRSAVLS